MTDFRVLCADLLAWAEKTSAHYYQQPDVLVRARAALAQPEPEGRTAPAPAGERQAAPVPVPVSERLPQPEDCDAEGRVWWWHVCQDGVGDWIQKRLYPSADACAFLGITHWLPAHALPLPSGEVEA